MFLLQLYLSVLLNKFDYIIAIFNHVFGSKLPTEKGQKSILKTAQKVALSNLTLFFKIYNWEVQLISVLQHKVNKLKNKKRQFCFLFLIT